MRQKQEKTKARIGYYGPWATCRNLSNEQRAERIKNGDPYIIRLKSPGNYNKKIICHDEIRGDLQFPENDIDIVINKADGRKILENLENYPMDKFSMFRDGHME